MAREKTRAADGATGYRALDRGVAEPGRAQSAAPLDKKIRAQRKDIHAELASINEMRVRLQFRGLPEPPGLLRRIDLLLAELARTSAEDRALAVEDANLIQKYGFEDRPSARAIMQIVAEEAAKLGRRGSLDTSRALERNVDASIGQAEGTYRVICANPAPPAAQTFELPGGRWPDMKKLIDEMLEASALVFNAESYSLSYRDWQRKDVFVALTRFLEQGTYAELWHYWDGIVDWKPPEGPEDPTAPVPQVPAGQYSGTSLEHEKQVEDPQSAENVRRKAADQASFEEQRKRALDVVRFFADVVGGVAPEFLEAHRAILDRARGKIEGWQWLSPATPLEPLFGPVPMRSVKPGETWKQALHPEATVVEDDPAFFELGLDDNDLRNRIRRAAGETRKTEVKPLVVHFAHGQDKLDAGGMRDFVTVVGEVSRVRSEFGFKVTLHVSGYADKTGEELSNQALSERRARRITEMLRASPAKDAIEDIYNAGCGDHFAPDEKSRPDYRVCVVRIDEDRVKQNFDAKQSP